MWREESIQRVAEAPAALCRRLERTLLGAAAEEGSTADDVAKQLAGGRQWGQQTRVCSSDRVRRADSTLARDGRLLSDEARAPTGAFHRYYRFRKLTVYSIFQVMITYFSKIKFCPLNFK